MLTYPQRCFRQAVDRDTQMFGCQTATACSDVSDLCACTVRGEIPPPRLHARTGEAMPIGLSECFISEGTDWSWINLIFGCAVLTL
jgi:hypothetical protein